MPHTHYTTLISATNLAERLAAAPGSVFVIDCRFDLADTEAGEKAYLAGHLPGAHYLHLDRDLSGPKNGHQRPASAAGSCAAGRDAGVARPEARPASRRL